MSWWTKIVGEPREKDEWRMCKQLDSTFIRTTYDSAGIGTDEKIHINYYLHETQHGDRKFDVADSLRGDQHVVGLEKDDIVFRLKLYRKTIKPWLAGRVDPDIPKWDDIPRHDYYRKLKGKK